MQDKFKKALLAAAIVSPFILTSCGTAAGGEIEVTLSNGEAVATIVTLAETSAEAATESSSESSESATEMSVVSDTAGDLLVANSVQSVPDYYVNYYGTIIIPGADAAPTIDQLGTGYEFYTTGGDDNTETTLDIYTYKDFTLFVSPSPVTGTDIISSIQFTTSDITTPEGIKISSSTEDAIAIYGDGYTDGGTYISYESGSSRMTFFISEGCVYDIEYDYIGM
ncbi:MAG: hypothetical protein K5745_00355 [Saccharofermentans sp.]|nr:hypothetical protein [Saccharofermentans sp.]